MNERPFSSVNFLEMYIGSTHTITCDGIKYHKYRTIPFNLYRPFNNIQYHTRSYHTNHPIRGSKGLFWALKGTFGGPRSLLKVGQNVKFPPKIEIKHSYE